MTHAPLYSSIKLSYDVEQMLYIGTCNDCTMTGKQWCWSDVEIRFIQNV